MIIKIKGNSEIECRKKLFSKINISGSCEKSLYGHYEDRFINEMYCESDGKHFTLTFEVGKPKKNWGGKRPGAGRPATGRKRIQIYGTDEEEIEIRKFLEKLRASRK